METDIFGSLKEWDKGLEILDNLKKSKKFDEHQVGLARILKYGQNWRLLESVLEEGKEIMQPGDEFLLGLFDVITDRGIYLDARILAVRTLEHVFPRMPKDHSKNHKLSQASVVRKMRGILNSPEPPILHEAIIKSLEAMVGIQQIGRPRHLGSLNLEKS